MVLVINLLRRQGIMITITTRRMQKPLLQLLRKVQKLTRQMRKKAQQVKRTVLL